MTRIIIMLLVHRSGSSTSKVILREVHKSLGYQNNLRMKNEHGIKIVALIYKNTSIGGPV